jgi:hypothetical protein
MDILFGWQVVAATVPWGTRAGPAQVGCIIHALPA